MRQFASLFIAGAVLLLLVSPSLAQYSGTYDIGGIAPDFPSIVVAAIQIRAQGVSGPVICNIHSGTFWEGEVHLNNIPGLGYYQSLTFQNAPGESPVVRSPYFNHNVFKIDSANYITIQGLEIRDCEETAIRIVGSPTDSCKQIRIKNNYIHNIGTTAPSAQGILLDYGADCEISGNKIDGDVWGIAIWYSNRTLVANNMVYGCYYGNYWPGTCIYGSESNYLRVYHNSCYATEGKPLYFDTCNNLTVKDNAVHQTGTTDAYAIQIYSGTGIICDYNDLYAPNGNVPQGILWRIGK